MNAVDRKENQDAEIGNQDRDIKSVSPVNAAKGIFVENEIEIVRQGVGVNNQQR